MINHASISNCLLLDVTTCFGSVNHFAKEKKKGKKSFNRKRKEKTIEHATNEENSYKKDTSCSNSICWHHINDKSLTDELLAHS